MYVTKTLKGMYIADNMTSNVAASSGLKVSITRQQYMKLVSVLN